MIEYTLLNVLLLELKIYCGRHEFCGQSKFGYYDKEKNRAPLTVKSYDPDTDYGHVRTVTFAWRYDIGSRSWHTLKSWTTIVWNIIQIQLGSEELWSGRGFWVCVRYDLDLGDMTFHKMKNYLSAGLKVT